MLQRCMNNWGKITLQFVQYPVRLKNKSLFCYSFSKSEKEKDATDSTGVEEGEGDVESDYDYNGWNKLFLKVNCSKVATEDVNSITKKIWQKFVTRLIQVYFQRKNKPRDWWV